MDAGPPDGPSGSRAGQPTLYFRLVSDLPIHLESPLDASLAAALDVEGKILRALEALGPIAGRDVVVVGGGEAERRRLGDAGGRVTSVEPFNRKTALRWSLPDASADAVLAAWSAFRGIDSDELAETDRILRPGGRLLVVHDYGRDDVSNLRGDLPEYSVWSRRDGPFLRSGFRIRVLHCFWTFESVEAARSFLAAAFGERGAAFGAGLKRPRLSYNVAVYHRTRGGAAA
jgi:hypothetical protein